MKILIVYAHPEPRSFNGAMKDLAVEVLTGEGHEVMVSDLYAMDFDPAGGSGDFTAREDPNLFRYQREQIHAHAAGLFVPDLQQEMDKLAAADLVIFQTPIWWFSLPAILKGWVDRVLAMGFSYTEAARYKTGLFRGKRAMLSITTGGLPAAYAAEGPHGRLDGVLSPIHRIFQFLGMEVLPPFVAYGAARVQPEQRAAYLAGYRERLLALGTTPVTADHAEAVTPGQS
jgi:NAD(P)H dehydrogenase (quinone)